MSQAPAFRAVWLTIVVLDSLLVLTLHKSTGRSLRGQEQLLQDAVAMAHWLET
jgi:hypothetical protein